MGYVDMTQLGKRPPLYQFILNPFEDVRFTTCPECSQRTLLQKIPLVVHVDPHHPVVLNKHCRYCPDCDILIAHQDELEHQLTAAFEAYAPEVIGNDYLVMGTVDKAAWRKQRKEPIPMGKLPEYLHVFKAYLTLSHTPAGWYPEDEPPTSREAPPSSTPTGWISQETTPVSTIDDPQQVQSLLKKMEAQLPIPAEIQRGPANYLRLQGSPIPPHRNVQINSVFYAGMKAASCVRSRQKIAKCLW